MNGLSFNGVVMVVGNGLLAKEFCDYKDNDEILIFASGVSNSKETFLDEFKREEDLLLYYLKEYGKDKRFIYFSTCSMYDTYFEMSEYTKHKIKMEELVIKNAEAYNIFRLPQVLGKNNKNQLIGFLHEQIKNKKSFELFKIERNIIDIKDISIIVNIVVDKNIKNEIINIANIKNIEVIKLVQTIEKICNEKAIYSVRDIEGSFNIDIERIKFLMQDNNIFEENYLENRIRNYYE